MMRKMHKNLANLNLDDLKKCAPEQLQTQSVTAVLLALGSNYQAEKYLPRVREKLAVLGEIQLSMAFQNPDFTATPELPKPDYTNQCVYLILTSVMTLQQLQHTFKKFESDCGRRRSSESIKNPMKIVTMDIDILLIKLDDKKNSLSRKWLIMADRYPFKTHERAGIEELVLDSYSKG
ncbi:2-amino-4-hydroxy-6-hydroxymethyldihydropteridine diphosphokinase [Psychrobacter luti]|uniref:2-amino-4-hydroxy-6-hydroxymethyldihydropteridine diphosphokinase n=1 Tax=Psychrobacter luti TaxID=198481 RepID=A0A839T9D7_9GAMM|nr:2-amino-4-hydroxy-6-hydroxymethyldihydropteridine diphosphokinase [Psychrobacter luti]MBB3105749.1 2-amino-4-hydroxy-6-hydroxymethyldihydropteridine diphosphokinase [Psychrobacter luti]